MEFSNLYFSNTFGITNSLDNFTFAHNTAFVEKGDVNEKGNWQVRFHLDTRESKNMYNDSGGVNVNNFFARSRRRIEGIDGLRGFLL